MMLPRPLSSKLSVAIVGSGFAGLTLANVLQKNEGDTVLVTVLESSSRLPGSSVFVGDINVPSLYTVLKHLSISIDAKDVCSDMDRVMISRQQLQKELYKNLRPGTVRCRQRVTRIEKRGDGLMNCIMEQANNDEIQDTTRGPFHVVVAADGVRSLFRTCRLKNVALVGDARWAQDQWWDFGYGRIRTGANVAMVDGLELGKLLLQDARFFCNVQSNDISPTLGHFSAEEKQRTIMMKRTFVLAIFIAFLSRILLGGFEL